jgi:hypothetical protein
MRVYIASFFADKDRVVERGKELKALGIECTSRWALEKAPHNCTITDKPAQYMRETAVFDIEDILIADTVVLTVPTPEQLMALTPHQMSRGGRTFESGFMYGLMFAASKPRELIIMGPKENVFHFLDGTEEAKNFPPIINLQTWEEVKQHLVAQL